MNEHCWHNTGYAFSNGFETSEQVRCCWCAAEGYRVTRRLGMDRVDGHGPYHEQPRFADRVEIRFGEPECPRKHQLLTELT